MADVGLRDLGTVVPGLRGTEPEPPPVPRAGSPAQDVLVTPPPPKPAAQAEPAPRGGFGGDLPAGADALGIDATLAHVAELVTHKRAASPLCIGLLGGPGAGKSFALARLAERVRALATSAGGLKESPFLSRVHVQPIDAASLEGEPALGLAARLHAGLRQPYPDLARELGHAARDPHLVLREVNEKLDEGAPPARFGAPRARRRRLAPRPPDRDGALRGGPAARSTPMPAPTARPSSSGCGASESSATRCATTRISSSTSPAPARSA